jgi:type IV pilus assembly protein PilO
MAKGFKDIPPIGQILILSLVAVAVVGGAWYYLVNPLRDEVATKQKQLDQLNRDNQENEAYRQRLVEYQARAKSLQQQLSNLHLIVPDEPEMDSYMKLVFADGQGTGIHVRTFVPQAEVQQKYYVEMPVRVHMDGTYWTLVNFFDRLAREQRIVSVTSMNLGLPQGGGMGSYKVGADETVGTDCVVTTYYNKPQSAAAAKQPPKKR